MPLDSLSSVDYRWFGNDSWFLLTVFPWEGSVRLNREDWTLQLKLIVVYLNCVIWFLGVQAMQQAGLRLSNNSAQGLWAAFCNAIDKVVDAANDASYRHPEGKPLKLQKRALQVNGNDEADLDQRRKLKRSCLWSVQIELNHHLKNPCL